MNALHASARRAVLCLNNRLLLCLLIAQLALVTISTAVYSADVHTVDLKKRWRSAISNDRSDILHSLLVQLENKHGDTAALLKTDAPNGKSALMVASKQGELHLVKLMVRFGADINEVTATGGTPFMFAVLGDHITVADWLYRRGANINARGSNGWSAATIAGAKGQTNMLEWLIESNANVDSPDVYRFTPLMRAVDNQHEDAVRALLESGRVNVNVVDESDNSALHFAVANQQVSVVRLLLNHGANPLLANRDGITPNDLAKNHSGMKHLFDAATPVLNEGE